MFRPATSPPALFTLILMSAVSVLSLNMFLPSLAQIADDLDADYALVTLSVSGFLALNGVIVSIAGPIADRFGRRPVLLVTTTLFVIASAGSAMADNIWLFLGARVVQAVTIAGSALASAIISDTTEKDQAASRMAYVAMAMAIAPMLGPMFGGFLDELFGWRASFWAFTIMGSALLWLIWADLGETNPASGRTFKEQVAEYPELLSSRRFWGYALCMAFSVGAFFFFISSAPYVSASAFQLTPKTLGLGIGSITGGFFLGSFLSGRYSTRMGIIWMVLAGRWVALFGVVVAYVLTVFIVSHPVVYFAGAVFVGFGNGLSIPNARAGTLAVRPQLAGSASGLSGALVVLIGAVLTQLPSVALTPQNAVGMAQVVLLVLLVFALIAAYYVRWVDRREAAANSAVT